VRAHHLDIACEAEGAGARDLARVLAAAEVELDPLAGGIDGRVVELDLEAQLVAVERVQARPLELGAFALTHLDRTQHADEALGGLLLDDAGALQQVDERGRRTIQDGHLFGRDVDIQVVQPQAGAGAHQVLDRVDLGATIGDGGGQAGVGDRPGVDRNLDRLGQVDPAKDDAGIGRCRAQGQLDTLPAVQSDADRLGQGFEGALRNHRSIVSFAAISRHANGYGSHCNSFIMAD
jgi:hypothetical protein